MASVEPNAPHRSVSALGFRRVEFVRLLVDEDGTTAEVTGITHRLPRTIRVPLHTAHRVDRCRRPETSRGPAPISRTGQPHSDEAVGLTGEVSRRSVRIRRRRCASRFQRRAD